MMCSKIADAILSAADARKEGLLGKYPMAAQVLAEEVLRLRGELEEVSWRNIVDDIPKKAQELLFVRGGKTVHGAWIGGIFWYNNKKCAAAMWMPLPLPPLQKDK